MRTRRVGTTGLQVSRLGLGTMGWASAPVSEIIALVKTFLTVGGSLIDTAAAYGNGDVERLIGRLLGKVIRRDEVQLMTKSGYVLRDGRRVIDTSGQTLLDDLTGSLRRLGTDYVDLWQLHAWGQAPLEETLAAADRAVTEGKARAVGVSNYIAWQLATAATWQQAVAGRTPIASVQVEYSLLARRAELEILPCCAGLGIGFFAWSALGRGVLAGRYRQGIPPDSRGANDNFSWFIEPYLAEGPKGVVEGVVRAGQGLGLSPAQVGLLWVRDAPGVTAALIGPRTAGQLEELVAVEDTVLPPVITAALDDASGGPNGLRQPARD